MLQQQQREPLTEFISCPLCCKVFNDSQQRPISLSCGHTVCKACLHGRLGNERCPFDQVPFPKDAEKLPSNYALMQLVEATSKKERSDDQGSELNPKSYEVACQCIQEIGDYLKPLAENSSDDEGNAGIPAADKPQVKCYLSRPLQRKVISLIQCQIIEEEGRARAARIARSIGERILCEILTAWQYPHQLSANLWAAVRARGCQFLGPAMQEEVLKLILLTLENGCMLSRKVLVLYVVGKLSSTYPHVSKTAIGHVVQLLYRASCFKVAKRDEESSLMQLKEEFREYDALRREHDAQIVQIAMEAGLRIPPEQWSSLLYGDMAHKSHMQSVMDKLQNPQSFSQCVLELVQVLQRNGDPGGFLKLRHRFEFLSCIDPNPDAQVPSLQDIETIMQSLSMVITAFVSFMSQPSVNRRGGHPDSQAVPNAQYKTSMCWDVATKGYCPRGNTCTFAHSQQELERHRQRSRRSMYKLGPKSDNGGVGKQQSTREIEAQVANLNLDSGRPVDNGQVSSPFVVTNGGDNMAVLKDHTHSHTHSVAGITDQTPLAHNMGNANVTPLPMPPSAHPTVNGTRLTFSQPAKEGLGMNFIPQTGFQTSFHPRNMRGPPPPIRQHLQQQSFIPPEGGYPPPTTHTPPTSSSMVNFPSYSHPQHNGPSRPHLHGQPLGNNGQLPNPQRHGAPTSHVHNHHQHLIQYPTPGGNSSPSAPAKPASHSMAPVTTMSGGSQIESLKPLNIHDKQHFQGRKDEGGEGRPNPSQYTDQTGLVQSPGGTVSIQPPSMYAVRTSDNGVDFQHQLHHHPQQQQQQQQQQPHSAMRMATHSFGGPDGALQSLTYSNSVMHPDHQLPVTPQENTLEDLRMMKKEIIHHLQEEPTFLSSRPHVYSADSSEGGFDGLRTVLGKNQRKREAMPILVSDMFVATRTTTSLDMLPGPQECPVAESKELSLPPPVVMESLAQHGHPAHLNMSTQSLSPYCVTMTNSSTSNNTLYNSLGSTFEIASSLSNIDGAQSSYPDTEFSCFPMDDDEEENLIPFEHTVVSKFGPISRMARAKTNNCAPVQVTADSSKNVTPVLAVTPMERPVPVAMPVNSRFGSFREQLPEPFVKPTPTEAPSVWQESPMASQMNIALLRTGAAEAISNNERLAYELQAIELEISLKTGRNPEPVRQMIHEAVSNPTTGMGMSHGMNDMSLAASASSQMAMLMTDSTSTSTQSYFSSPSSRNSGVNMSHGHVTEFLTSIGSGTNTVSSELAARDIMEEYQRSWKGTSKSSY